MCFESTGKGKNINDDFGKATLLYMFCMPHLVGQPILAVQLTPSLMYHYIIVIIIIICIWKFMYTCISATDSYGIS